MSNNKPTVSELLKDEFFVRWVLNPTRESDYYWQQWMERNSENRENVLKARQIIDSLNQSEIQQLSDTEHNQLLSSLVNFLQIDKEKAQSRNRPGISVISKYAAIIIFLIMATGIGYLLYNSQELDLEQPIADISTITKSVPFGQKNTIKFIDGSEVKMNSGSQIQFIPGFEEDRRMVQLEGEAFFDIAKDENRPFYIEVGNTMVKVIGTSFNINSFKESDMIKVAVVSGKVEFTTEAGEVVKLEKNEMVTYDEDRQSIEVGDYNYLNEVAWKDGVLVFAKDDIHAVVRKLQRWYGVEVILSDQNISGLYNGEFKDSSLEFVLEGVSFAYDLDYSIDGKIVELK